jgi:hypothetical protein
VQHPRKDVAKVGAQLLDAPLAVAGIRRMHHAFLPELLNNLAYTGPQNPGREVGTLHVSIYIIAAFLGLQERTKASSTRENNDRHCS